eukprot:1744941-Rhodomonas_salina.1
MDQHVPDQCFDAGPSKMVWRAEAVERGAREQALEKVSMKEYITGTSDHLEHAVEEVSASP